MSFLRDYIHATGGTESPEIYHKWCGLSALSSIISRRVWLDREAYVCFPNIYVLLVGAPGISKTTAMNIPLGLISRFPQIPVAPTSTTKEALTKALGSEDSPYRKSFKDPVSQKVITYTHCSLFCSELITLLEAGQNPTNTIGFLTDIYDPHEHKPFVVETKGAGTDTIERPYVTLLGCLTTDKMSTLLTNKIISAGFHRRCIFVYSNDYGDPVPHIHRSDSQKAAGKRLYDRAKQLLKISGPFTWDPDAYEWYSSWYCQLHELKKNEPSTLRQGFYSSKRDIVLKLAMLIQLADSDELLITTSALELAVAFIDEIEPDMAIVFEGAGRNELSPIGHQIKARILKSPDPIPVKRLLVEYWSDAKDGEIQEVLQHLERSGQIKLHQVTKDSKTLTLACRPDYVPGAS